VRPLAARSPPIPRRTRFKTARAPSGVATTRHQVPSPSRATASSMEANFRASASIRLATRASRDGSRAVPAVSPGAYGSRCRLPVAPSASCSACALHADRPAATRRPPDAMHEGSRGCRVPGFAHAALDGPHRHSCALGEVGLGKAGVAAQDVAHPFAARRLPPLSRVRGRSFRVGDAASVAVAACPGRGCRA
jgi:hypothetical protein